MMTPTEPAAIANNGWLFYQKCKCGGILKQKYRHPDKPGLQLEWWVRYYQFKITQLSKTKIPQIPLSKLEDTLKNLS